MTSQNVPEPLSTREATQGLLTGPTTIPASSPTVTSPFKVDLSPDGQSVRISVQVPLDRFVTRNFDLDPTAAFWLSAQLQAHARTVIQDEVLARRRATVAPELGEPVGPYLPTRGES